MTNSSVCSIYVDLAKLLEDINKFLEEQVKSGSLKSETISAALKLIDRSKQQIERISPQNDDYVVMHNNVSITEAENDNEDDDHYALVVETNKKCDVAELAATEIPKTAEIKSGPLTYHRRTDRWFFRREQHIKVFGAVFDDHLLIYKNEKSEKPLFCLNLSSYKGQKLTNSKKKTGAFAVTDKNQTYNFIARDEKDMEQWLNQINKLDCQLECLRPRTIVTKPKMQLRPIPDIPQPSQRSYNTEMTYATPGEDYYAMDLQKNNSEDGEYSSVADDNEKREEEDEEDDEKIYAIVVPPSASIRPVHSSFIHRQTARR